MVQFALLSHATAAVVLPQPWSRRCAMWSACTAAAVACTCPVYAALPASAQASTMDLRDALAAASPAQEAIFKRLPNPPRPPTPPAALLLRAEEVCHDQEVLLRSASENIDQNLILARAQTSLFVRILIRNTNLEQISGAQGAVAFIRGVVTIAEAGLGPPTSGELLAMAKQYRAAQDELRVVFEGLPPDKQEKGRAVARELRHEDEERRAAAAREAQEAARQEAERIGRLYRIN